MPESKSRKSGTAGKDFVRLGQDLAGVAGALVTSPDQFMTPARHREWVGALNPCPAHESGLSVQGSTLYANTRDRGDAACVGLRVSGA